VILLKKYIKELLDSDSVFVSIGANDGIFVDEIFQSNLLNISWKSFFIEPVKETFDRLVENYNRHYSGNSFTFINKAISTYDGEGFLVTNKVDDSMGMCSFFRPESDQTIKIPVSCITFDNLVKKYNISYIDFLKIDTEGMDYEIVNQCLSLKIYPKIILMEHIGINNSNVTTYDQMKTIVDQEYVIIRDTPEYQYENDNILLIKKQYV
jgi:FkbM family methyltransferase